MKYLKLNSELFLVEQEIPKQNKVDAFEQPSNHIWIYDRSWSMYYDLPQLTEDLINKAKELKTGDTLSLGWFSGEGQYNFVLKGFKFTNEADLTILEDVIRKNSSTVGTTCFSEILSDVKTVVDDLSVFGSTFSLCFFTDGYPVVSNYRKEIDNIHKAVADIRGKVTASLLVGYGDYYNKDLMTTMAKELGGHLTHSDDLHQFNIALKDFILDSRGNGPRVRMDVRVAGEVKMAFSLSGDKTVNQYALINDGGKMMVDFIPTRWAHDYLFFVTDKLTGDEKELSLTDAAVSGKNSAIESFVKGAYAASFLLSQSGQSDLALELLGKLGDIRLIKKLSNAFTNTEFGEVESEIQEAAAKPRFRLRDGRNTKFLPAEDAPCLLDVLDLLSMDSEAFFYPYHEEFNYKRIGLPSKVIDGYPKFQPENNVKCSFSSLTWNQSRLNLSVLAKIPGHVELSGDYEKYGFNKKFPTHVYRNYTLVRDGALNVSNLPLSCSDATLEKLQDLGVVGKPYDSGDASTDIYVADLKAIPIMNRSIAKNYTSATKLCRQVWKETELKAKLKVLRSVRDSLSEYKADNVWTPEQETFLETHGITKNGFNPPTEKVDGNDSYMAKEFKIKIKGFSSLPKVSVVESKVQSGKNLTPVEKVVKAGLDLVNSSNTKTDPILQRVWSENQIKELEKELFQIRQSVQRAKFAIILGKKWFKEFNSREENTLDLDNKKYTLELREVAVKV